MRNRLNRKIGLTVLPFAVLTSLGLALHLSVRLESYLRQELSENIVQLGHYEPLQTLSLFPLLRTLVGPTARAIPRWISANLKPQSLPVIELHIKQKPLQELYRKREQAIKDQILVSHSGRYVPATIVVAEESLQAKVRLKGDWADHFESTQKLSLRIRMKGDGTVFGMESFSIQHPKTRSYQYEPIILDQMRRQGVLAPRYFFARCRLNGQPMGIMAIEEHFSQTFLESQRRPEGLLLKYDETELWQFVKEGVGDQYSWQSSTARPFREKEIAQSESQQEQLGPARRLMLGFQRQTLKVSDVFDTLKLARFLAVLELWDGSHGFGWNNVRFYYNPEIGKLEPIAYDIDVANLAWNRSTTLHTWNSIFSHTLKDTQFHRRFEKELHQYAKYVLANLSGILEQDRNHLSALHAEFPYVPKLSATRLQKRAKELNGYQVPEQKPKPFVGGNYPHILKAYLISQGGKRYLEFHNMVPLPVEVLKIQSPHDFGKNKTKFGNISLPVQLPPLSLDDIPIPVRIPILEDKPIEIIARVKHTQTNYAIHPTEYVATP